LDRKIGGGLYVGSRFGLEEYGDAIANGIGEAAMRTAEGGVSFRQKRAFADGASDEIEEFLGNHDLILHCERGGTQPNDYFMRLAGRFTITG